MTQKKKKSLTLGGLFSAIFTAFVLMTNPVLGADKIIIDDSSQGGVEDFVSSVPKSSDENLFSNFSSGIFQRVYSFNFSPFLQSEINFRKNKNVFSPGEKITLSGSIKYSNKNSAKEIDNIRQQCLATWKGKENLDSICPKHDNFRIPFIDDARLLVQVWRVDDSENRSLNGDFLVDEFYVDKVFMLKEGQEERVTFNYALSDKLQNGKYYFSFFVNSKKEFPVINFVQNIFSPLDQESFQISDSPAQNQGIFLDKDNIELNDSHYFPIRRTPTIDPMNGKFRIKIPVKNTSAKDEEISVRYRLFNWTQENEKNIILEKNEKVFVNGGGSRTLEFLYSAFPGEAANSLQIETTSSFGKTLANVPFVINKAGKARMTFLGQAEKDGKLYPYACVQYYGWEKEFNGKIRMEAKYPDGREMAKWEGAGNVSINDAFCFVLKDGGFEKIPQGKCFNLKGEIYENEKIVFSEEIGVNCTSKENSSGILGLNLSSNNGEYTQENEKGFAWASYIIYIIALILAALAFYSFFNNKIKKKND